MMPSAPAIPTTALPVAVPRILAGVGGLVFVLGLLLSPRGVWPDMLLCVFGLACTGLGGALFVALLHVTGARWGRRVLPVAHAMVAILPFTAAATVAFAFGSSFLWPWADPSAVAADPHLGARGPFMSVPFLLARQAVCYVVWIGLGAVLLRRSRRAIAVDDVATRAAAARAAAWFLVGFAPTFSMTAFDLVLSLERQFSSTIFAIHHFAGAFLSALALITMLALAAARRDLLPARAVAQDVLHDLGKLLFAFAFFWGYIWFCQFMLIWYTNMPEETGYYALRHAGGWEPIAILNVLLNWTVPFLLLLSARAKQRPRVLWLACVVILVGRLVDLHLAIVQPSLGASPALRLSDVALPVGACGAFLWSWRRAFAREGSGAGT